MKDYINIKSHGWSVRIDLESIPSVDLPVIADEIRDPAHNWEAIQAGDRIALQGADIRTGFMALCTRKDPHARIIEFKGVE